MTSTITAAFKLTVDLLVVEVWLLHSEHVVGPKFSYFTLYSSVHPRISCRFKWELLAHHIYFATSIIDHTVEL